MVTLFLANTSFFGVFDVPPALSPVKVCVCVFVFIQYRFILFGLARFVCAQARYVLTLWSISFHIENCNIKRPLPNIYGMQSSKRCP